MAVELRSVHVISLFDRTFDLKLTDLNSGLNIVYAENGVGKSTVAGGVAAVFDPTGQPRSTRVHAEFRSEGNLVSVILNGNNVEPSLWQNPRAGLCRLGISDILRAEDPDSQVLVAALTGGIDLATVLPFSSPRIPSMKSVVERLTARERQARQVADDEAELKAKDTVSRNLAQAVKDLAIVKRWLEAIDLDEQAESKENDATAITTEFPGIGEQSEDAVEQANSLFTHWERTKDQLRGAIDVLARISDVSADRSLMEIHRATAGRLREQLVRLQDSVTAAEIDLNHRKEVLDSALKSIVDFGGDRESVPTVGIAEKLISNAKELDTAVESRLHLLQNAKRDRDHAVEREQAERNGLEATVELPKKVLEALLVTPAVPNVADDARARVLERKVLNMVSEEVAREATELIKIDNSVVRALVDWLSATPSGESSADSALRLRHGFALAFAVLAAIGAQLVFSHWAGVLLLALGAALVYAWTWRRLGETDNRKSVVARIPGVFHPAVWDSASVAARLEELLLAKTTFESKSAWSAELMRRANGVDNEPVAILEERRRQFKAECGVAEPEDPYRFGHLIHRLNQWHEAVAARDAAFMQYANTESEWETACRRRQDWLDSQPGGKWSTGNVFCEWVRECRRIGQLRDGVILAEQHLEQTKTQMSDVMELAEKLVDSYGFPVRGDWTCVLEIFPKWFDASEALESAQDRENTARKELVQALKRFGVPESDNLPARLDTLRRREQDALRYRNAMKEAEDLRSKSEGLRQDVDQPFWERHMIRPESVRADWEELEDRLGDPSLKKEEVDQTRGAIRNSISALENAVEWFDLEREADSQIQQASHWIDSKLQFTANKFVRNAIENAVELENMPMVVERTHHWMTTFTGGQYDKIGIVVDEIKEGKVTRHLVVRDTGDGMREKRLSQLSTGTRAHVALAIRMAVLEESERGAQRLPLLVDEILAASGHEARENIAAALCDIARDRQVVYFTNSGGDIELLRHAMSEVDAHAAPGVHTYGLAGSLEPVIKAIDVDLPPIDVPEPDGLPLWQGVSQWSPAWKNRFFGDAYELSDQSQSLIQAAEAVRVILAKNVRRLEWAELISSGLVSKTMEDRLRSHYDATGGDARRFIATLGDVDGVGNAARLKYSEWLGEHGYFEPLPTRQELVKTAQTCLPVHSGVLAHGVVALFEVFMKLE
jgi:hypothetical protein